MSDTDACDYSSSDPPQRGVCPEFDAAWADLGHSLGVSHVKIVWDFFRKGRQSAARELAELGPRFDQGPGLAGSAALTCYGMAYDYYKSDYQRFAAAWHAARCRSESCVRCDVLCQEGLVISCDGCGRVHHTDWLGWDREMHANGSVTVLCPECEVGEIISKQTKEEDVIQNEERA